MPSLACPNRMAWVETSILLATMLLAFGLRTFDLASLRVHGDYSYSIYAAQRDLPAIAWERVLDGHPPLYYYLLHFWIGLTGQAEVSFRILSVLAGVLLVPVAWVSARRWSNRRAALLSALFVAVSPALVYYSRYPRMYIFLALFALLSVYALWRATRRNDRNAWLLYVGATAVMLYTHYYGLAVVAGEAAFILLMLVHRRILLLPAALSCAGLAALFVPWLAYAALSSANATTEIISNAPWPDTIAGVLEQLWLPANTGYLLDIRTARPLGLAMLVLVGLAAVARRGQIVALSRRLALPLLCLGVPVAGALAIYLVAPYAVRPRFLIFAVPLYLIVLAAFIAKKPSWMLAGSIPILVTSALALTQSFAVEPHTVEADAVILTEQVERVAKPDDAIVFHAFWQIGYFKTHYHGVPPATYNMQHLELPAAIQILERHPRVWLATYRIRQRDPGYPLEEWLDRHWHRGRDVKLGDTRLILYQRPSQAEWRSLAADFGPDAARPEIRLEAVQVPSTPERPGGSVAIGLRWRTPQKVQENYTVFLQLLDEKGTRWAGSDSEPLGGSEPTSGWLPGQVIDHLAVIELPVDIPPGRYRLATGVYPTGNPKPLPARLPGGGPASLMVEVGTSQVIPRALPDAFIIHPMSSAVGDRIRLLGHELDIDRYREEKNITIDAQTDNPVWLSIPRRTYRPGGSIHLSLFWQSLAPVLEDYTVFAQLLDSEGKVRAQSDSQPVRGAYPTSRWEPGEVVIDGHELKLADDLPAGEYRLVIGMYELSTMQRLPVNNLNPPGGTSNAILLRRLKIEP